MLLEGHEEVVQDLIQLSIPLLLLLLLRVDQRLAACSAATPDSAEDVSSQSLAVRVVCGYDIEAHHHFL